jgi:hypothetical protein
MLTQRNKRGPAISRTEPARIVTRGGLHMSTELNNDSSQEAPQWMRDMFEALKDMFEALSPDADTLNLEEMQRRLDEQQAHFRKKNSK